MEMVNISIIESNASKFFISLAIFFNLCIFLLVYYKLATGAVCDDSNNVIRSLGECTDALKSLGFLTNVSYWTGSYSTHIPAGCSIRDGPNNHHVNGSIPWHPHFETSKAGVGKGRKDLIPICKKPQSSGNFVPWYLDLKSL